MRNPLRNEDAAFRVVLGTIAYLAPIVVASWLAPWLGVVTFVVATAIVIELVRRSSSSGATVGPPARAAVEDTWRILVIADETLEGPHLQEIITRLAEGVAEDVLVVCPATLPGSVGAVPDAEIARVSTEVRLQSAVAALRAAGIDARGEIGSPDPLAALEAALRDFAADEVLISTHARASPPGSSRASSP